MDTGTLIVIPARAGSKGLEGKNLQQLRGVTLVAHAAHTAHGAHDNVIVSTDSQDIADEVGDYGVIHWRNSRLCEDDATSDEVVAAVAREQIEADKLTPESIVAMIQCTSPLLQSSHVQACITLARNNGGAAFTAIRGHYHVWPENPGSAIHTPRSPRPARQQLDAQYLETGGCYATSARNWVKHGRFGDGTKVGFVTVPRHTSLEIDSKEDLHLVEAIAKGRGCVCFR